MNPSIMTSNENGHQEWMEVLDLLGIMTGAFSSLAKERGE